MHDRGRRRSTVLACAELLRETASLLRGAKEDAFMLSNMAVSKADLLYRAGRLEYYAEWLIEDHQLVDQLSTALHRMKGARKKS